MKKYIYLVEVFYDYHFDCLGGRFDEDCFDEDCFDCYGIIEDFSSKSEAIRYVREVFNIPDNISFREVINYDTIEYRTEGSQRIYYKKGEENTLSRSVFSCIIKKEDK